MKVDNLYDDLARHIKESAGLPAYFYDLSVEQRFFVEDFYEAFATPEPTDEAIEVRELVLELMNATEALINRYSRR